MESLQVLTNKLEQKIEYCNCLSPKVSQAPVGWHIEHTLLTTDIIIKAIAASDPEKYKAIFSFAKLYIFTLNNIPRGRIQSPEAVRPKEGFTPASLKNHVDASFTTIKQLNTFSHNHYFPHPVLGNLNVKPAKKFLCIHTAHHLRIIDDILKSVEK